MFPSSRKPPFSRRPATGAMDLTAHSRAYVCVLTGVRAKGKKATRVIARWAEHHALTHTYTHVHRKAYARAQTILLTHAHTCRPTRLVFGRAKNSLSRLTGGVIVWMLRPGWSVSGERERGVGCSSFLLLLFWLNESVFTLCLHYPRSSPALSGIE